LLIFIF